MSTADLSGSKGDNSLPPSDDIKNKWSYTSAPPLSFHGVYRENFAFTCKHRRLNQLTNPTEQSRREASIRT